MRRVGWRGVRRGGATLCVLMLILLAAGTGGAFWLQREVPQHREELTRWLETSLGVVVTLEDMALHWTWRGPDVALGHVTVRARDQQIPVAFREVRVGFSFGRLLAGRKAVPSRVEIRQADLAVERRLDGRWLVQGIPLGRGESDAGPAWKTAVPVLERLGEITLRDSTVSLTMAGREEPVQRFTGVDIHLRSAGTHHRIDVSSRSAAMLGRNFLLSLDAHGALAAPQNWVIDAAAELMEAAPKDYFEPWVGRWLDLRGSHWNLRLAGHWDAAGESRLTLNTDLRNVRLPATATAAESRLDRLSGNFRWQGREEAWTLQLDDLAVALDGRSWPRVDGNLAVLAATDARAGSYQASLSAARLQDVQRLWQAVPAAWRRELDGVGNGTRADHPIEGEIRDLRFAAKGGAAQGWDDVRLSARFTGLGWAPLGAIPGLTGLDGEIDLDRSSGWARLSGDAIGFRAPALFDKSWPKGSLQTELQWEREGDALKLWSPGIRVRHPDLNADATLALAMPAGQRPAIDLQVDFRDGNAAALDRYLPRRYLPAPTARWLRSAILDGRLRDGRLRLQGDLQRFPFRHGGGTFEVVAHVEDGALQFNPHWPVMEAVDAALTFTGTGFRVDAKSARSVGMMLGPTTVEMKDYREQVLTAVGRGQGDHQAALDYLGQSPPGRAVRVLLDGARASGPVRLDLALRLPLRALAEVSVDGAVHWDGARFMQPAWRVGLEDIRGTLRFHEDRLQAEDIDARLEGESVRLRVSPIEDPRKPRGFRPTRVQMQGRVPATLLRRQLSFLDPRTMQGATGFDGDLAVLGGGQMQWSLRSPLTGMRLDWPTPLGKTADEERALIIEGNGDADRHLIQFHQGGDGLHGLLRLQQGGSGWSFDRGGVGINQRVERLPEQPGLWIRGALDRLDLAEVGRWTSVWAPAATDNPNRKRASTLPAWFGGGEVSLGVAEWKSVRQTDVRLALLREGVAPTLQVRAPALEGVLHRAGDTVWQADLRWLDLDALIPPRGADAPARASVPPPAASTFDPRQVPAARVRVDRLRYRGSDVGRLNAQLEPATDGIVLSRGVLESPVLQARGSGAWRLQGSRAQTSLRLDMETGDLPTLARRLGYPDAIEARKATLTADLVWPGAPWDMTLRQASGSFKLGAEDGAIIFRETRPTTGVVMSLAGLYDLPRRLTRDFSGVFRPSLPFDTIRGDLSLRGGIIETSPLELKGSAADVRMSGTSDLARRRFDQELVVTPSLSAGLAIAATVAGGPIAGAAVLMGRELLRQPISRLVQIRYRFAGDFDAATLEREQGPFNLPEGRRP